MSWTTALTLGSFVIGLPTAVTSFYDMKLRRLELYQRTSANRTGADAALTQAPVTVGGAAPPVFRGPTSDPVVYPTHTHGATTIRRLSTPPGIGRRLLSYLIDLYGSIFVAAVVATFAYDPVWDAEAWSGTYYLLLVAALIGTTALNGRGQSPGKWALGTKLVRQNSRTETIGFRTSALRMACMFVPFQYLRIFKQDRKTLADVWTKTHLVRTR